jgi:hypothetical protein
MAASATRRKPVLGWRERVSLPALGVLGIRAKVDTGARTSALHATGIRRFRRRGKRMVRFKVFPGPRRAAGARPIDVEATLWAERKVRDSSGRLVHRPVILTALELADDRWVIEVGLTERTLMGYPMLLGRQAIRGRFYVDPGRSFLRTGPAAAPRRRRRKAGTR